MPLWNHRAVETMRYSPRNIAAMEIASILLEAEYPRLLEGIQSFTLDLPTKSLVFVGPPDILYKQERLLRLLDVKTPQVRLEFRFQKEGKDIYQGEIAAAKNNKPNEWARGNFSLTFTPHVNGDGSLTLQVETYSEKRFARITSSRPFSFLFNEGTLLVVSPSTALR